MTFVNLNPQSARPPKPYDLKNTHHKPKPPTETPERIIIRILSKHEYFNQLLETFFNFNISLTALQTSNHAFLIKDTLTHWETMQHKMRECLLNKSTPDQKGLSNAWRDYATQVSKTLVKYKVGA